MKKPAPLAFHTLGLRVQIEPHPQISPAALNACFRAMMADVGTQPVDLRIHIDPGDHGFRIHGGAAEALESSPHNLLWTIEKYFELNLQLLRPELIFVHAAVMVRDGEATLFIGPSGAGKSTLLALLGASKPELGPWYYSDELAPIDPRSLCVWPYPKGLWLKESPQKLGVEALSAQFDTVHPRLFQRAAQRKPRPPVPIRRLVALGATGSAKAWGTGRAAMSLHLLSQTLNNAAHENFGLSVVQRLTQSCDCRVLEHRPYQDDQRWGPELMP